MATPKQKDPDAIRDYLWDWTKRLDSMGGDTIASVEFFVPAGLTLLGQANTTTTAQARIGGGTQGEHYEVVCRMTTNTGQRDDWTLFLRIAHN